LLIGALMGAAISLLSSSPHLMARTCQMANCWISTRRMDQLLDRSIGIEQWFTNTIACSAYWSFSRATSSYWLVVDKPAKSRKACPLRAELARDIC
jgi:hypothetical protein